MKKTAYLILILIFILTSCKKEEPTLLLPELTTTAVNSITQTTAISGGNITNDGGAPITARGVCWSNSQNPTINVNKTSDGSGTGSFISSIIGLFPDVTYYVRAYAINSAGTAYGNEISFTTALLTITDADGNVYNTITIGSQTWMAENLKTTKYMDNVAIAYPGTDNAAWQDNTTGAYAWYDNNEAMYKATYGALYNWYAVNTGKLCPAGWHVPSDSEWKTLDMNLGMSQATADQEGWRGTDEGSKLAGNAALWTDGALDANSVFCTSGFTGLPGGFRNLNGEFFYVGSRGRWWSSNENGEADAWYRSLYFLYSNAGREYGSKLDGFSVRCLRD